MKNFEIEKHQIGDSQPCFIIAEVAQAHDGSLGIAHAFIDVVADAGADAVKFQTHIASAESTKDEPWRVKFSPQDESRYDYWSRMEFTAEQWQGLRRHANDRGLVLLSSPFSVEAVELLDRIGMPAWKVASGEVTNPVMLRRMAKTGAPVLISSGMSSWRELDQAVQSLKPYCSPYALFQCTTAYPCPPEKVGLNVLEEMRARYRCPVGLSDHSGTIFPSLAAVSLNASLLEVHVTMSRHMFGPDVPASVTPEELRQLVRGTRFINQSLANPLDKDQIASQMSDLKKTFGKSVVLRHDVQPGTRLSEDNLTVKKPGGGIPAHHLDRLLGRELSRAAKANQRLSEDMLSDAESTGSVIS